MADRATVMGFSAERLDLDGTTTRCLEYVASGVPARHVSLNVAKLVAARTDPTIRQALAEAEIVSADGQPIVWASRLLGDPLPERVAGVDLMERLLGAAATRGLRVFILGARSDVLGRAVAELAARHPGLVVEAHHGHFPAAEDESVLEHLRRAKPEMLFVAMSSPRKEEWIERGHRLGIPLSMGVGGAVDVLAGERRRAPRVLRRAGLEWAFRMAQEPRRLVGRYARTNGMFAAMVVREVIRVRLSGARTGSGT